MVSNKKKVEMLTNNQEQIGAAVDTLVENQKQVNELLRMQFEEIKKLQGRITWLEMR